MCVCVCVCVCVCNRGAFFIILIFQVAAMLAHSVPNKSRKRLTYKCVIDTCGRYAGFVYDVDLGKSIFSKSDHKSTQNQL